MLLFTCSVSRAGHLELPENEKEFINGLKRLLEGEGQNENLMRKWENISGCSKMVEPGYKR